MKEEMYRDHQAPLHLRTGKLPINAETPPEILWSHDVTPTENFYVRSHGEAPDLTWDRHCVDLAFRGKVIHRLSMDELSFTFAPLSIQVTLVCDGNRRKELNMIKRTNGFDWGCCALSTGEFKGALLRDVLLRFYDSEQIASSSHVCFESADKLYKGVYGTALPMHHVMDETTDVMLAYGLNGKKLPINHGFPVRTVIPGGVGGRTVKWLQRIELNDRDSTNPYHLEDNCVFPESVTSTALLSKTVNEYRKREDTTHPFVLYEMNLNSAILFPEHGTTIEIHDNFREECEINGYAYDGGGRKIQRMEMTLDNGESWYICRCRYPDHYQPRHGSKWWVMCKWSISVPLWKLAIAKAIQVRAWNSSTNTQPERHNWNILGMMNNAWYTVHIEREGANLIRFLHPVSFRPSDPHGWMEERYPRTRYDEKQVPPATYTREEVRQHNSISDCWVIIDDRVYDLTDFLNLHPGGQASISAHAGEDVTVPFYDIHSEDTHVFKTAYVIGLVEEQVPQDQAPQDQIAQEQEKVFARDRKQRHPFLGKRHPRVTPDGKEVELTPFKWTHVTLKKKQNISHDTRRFTFALSSPDKRMWLPWGKHVNIGIELSDRMVVRPYTPVKPILYEEDDGTFELIVKIYFPTDTRPGGEMTQILEKLEIGEQVMLKGPEGALWYLGNGQFSVHGHFFFSDRMNFVAGGTGITPILAVLRAVILAERNRKRARLPEMRLVYANKTMKDILCREQLKDLVRRSGGTLSICHVISSPDNVPTAAAKFEHGGEITYAVGYVNADNMGKVLLSAESNASCFLCGPPAMMAKAVFPALVELGFDYDQMFEF